MKYIKRVKPFFIDDRGEMIKLFDENDKITSALYITCNKGAIRANHYHKKDTHYSYMVSGKMEYSYKNVNSKNPPKSIIVKTGEMVYTPAMIIHSMRFLEDSVFIALATKPRSRKNYENDTIRIELIK